MDKFAVGIKVIAAKDLYEDDWYEVGWDGEDEPVCIPKYSVGEVIGHESRLDWPIIRFEGGYEWICVPVSEEYPDGDIDIAPPY